MKTTRKQKNRKKHDVSTAIKHLTSNYFSIVDTIFTYGEWIYKVMPEYKDVRAEQTIKWFIAQTLVYLNLFGRRDEATGKTVITLNKEEFSKVMTDNDQINSLQYTEDFTKEMMVDIIKVGIEKFYTQDMFPVIDTEKEGDNGTENQ